MSRKKEIRSWLRSHYGQGLGDVYFKHLLEFVEEQTSLAYREGVRDGRALQARVRASRMNGRRAWIA